MENKKYKYNIIFTEPKKLKDAKGDMVLTEDVYEKLLNKAYKGKELSEIYEIPNLGEIFEEAYDELGYPTDTTWFIHPEVLRDEAKMKKLYEKVRNAILDLFNDESIFEYDLSSDDIKNLKRIFKIKYTFGDSKFITDDEVDFLNGEEDNSSENNNSSEEDLSELEKTCKEFLEDYEYKDAIKKDSAKWYLIQMALGKDKGWAYIRKADELKGNVDLDIVTPKNAKKIMKAPKED